MKGSLKDKIIGILITAFLGIFGYSYMHFENKIEFQSNQINQIDKKITSIAAILQTKYPKLNIPNILNFSAQKNISPQTLVNTLDSVNENPDMIKQYLNQLGFTGAEIKSSLLKDSNKDNQKSN